MRRRHPVAEVRRPRARLAAALCAGALLAVTGGCDDTVSPPGPVVLAGDSIFAMASDELTAALEAADWEATVDAYPGAGILGGGYAGVDWPTRLHDLVAFADPEVVIIELGTNGCGPCTSIPEAIDANMTQLRDVDLVLWLDVNTSGPAGERGRSVNAALRDAAGRWDNLEILPYDEWFAGRSDLLAADSVHPTPAGEQALADHVADALDARSGPAGGGGSKALGALVLVVAAVVLFRPKG